MEAFAFYLIKSSVWLTGFSLIYFLFLRNERFFVLNRIFLVCGILISLIFPLFTWHYTVLLPVVPSIDISDPQVLGVVVADESFTTQNALLFFYLSGVIFLLFRLFWQTLPVFRIIRKSETHQYSSAKLIRTAEYPASFSFFSFVFVNPSIGEIETNEIVNHEMEHIRQRHWIDLLLFEILRTLQWFNPLSWLYGHFIRQNHEYQADERALQRSSNPAIYRAALLNQMFGGPVISLANSFNYSLNKKRFNMMKHTISSPIRKFKLLLVLPLMAGVFYAFAAPEYKILQAEELAANLTQNEKIVKGKVIDESGKPLKSASVVVSGKTIGTTTDDNGNFKLKMPDNSPIVISYVGFESQKVNPDFDKEMVITMKIETIGINLNDDISTSNSQKVSNSALIFIDGKESTKAEMDKINPDKIERVEVLKNQTSLEEYGEKAKDGIIFIYLKPDENSLATQTIKVQSNSPFKFGNSDGSGNQPLIVKDGIVAANQDVKNIPPESIESITVLNGESATKKYGEKGKDGVVEITMKIGESNSQNETIEVKVTGYANDQKENKANSGIQIRSTGTSGIESKPLFVVDGVIAENQNMDKIDPETIESMNVLKDESATKKYGEKGKNGVVEIISKKASDTFVIVEEMPEFPGGMEALKAFIIATMKYPIAALENGIQGKVFVNFIVTKTGSVAKAKVVRGDPSLDNEAIRVVEAMPKWKPGKQNVENVDVSYTVPVDFSLPPNKKQ